MEINALGINLNGNKCSENKSLFKRARRGFVTNLPQPAAPGLIKILLKIVNTIRLLSYSYHGF